MKTYTKTEDGQLLESEEIAKTEERVYKISDLLNQEQVLVDSLVEVRNLIAEFKKLDK